MTHGHLAHVPVGTFFTNRRSLYAASVHRDIRRGICGSGLAGRGAESIVLSGGYEDDVDLGQLVYYTGQGPKDSAGRPLADQTMSGLNASLARNVETGDPVRLVRAVGGALRYDGLYSVVDAWIAPGKSGFLVCRYRLEQSAVAATHEPGTTVKTVVDRGGRGQVAKDLATHYRLKRDGQVPTLIKRLYDYSCQICGVRIETVAGAYAEGAHLAALSAGGDDHTSNVLCLCPNHHVMLDHGAIAITDDFRVIGRDGSMIGELTLLPEHGLSSTNAQAHRARMGFA